MSKVAVFSKLEMSGGSEFRCVELCNGLARFTDNEVFLLAEHKIPDKLQKYLDPKVQVICDVFSSPKYFYDLDILLIVNTDTKDFSLKDYWLGKTARHNIPIDLNRMVGKKIFFLYNFLVSPSRHLSELSSEGWDIRIIVTNTNFFNEIGKQDRYDSVKILPRYILESPINPDSLIIRERKVEEESPVVFGMHSKRAGSKWNDDIPKLINKVNQRYGEDRIKFRFMGIKGELTPKLAPFENAKCLKEDEEVVKDFINSLDVFLFFPDWKREEPWSRVVAEGMVAGCPIIALDKGGTKDQVLHLNNGFLCKNFDDYYNRIIYFMEHKNTILEMSKNSLRISKSFYTEKIIQKFMEMAKI